jgi:hypothetical protein
MREMYLFSLEERPRHPVIPKDARLQVESHFPKSVALQKRFKKTIFFLERVPKEGSRLLRDAVRESPSLLADLTRATHLGRILSSPEEFTQRVLTHQGA